MTHEKSVCPLLVRQRQNQAIIKRLGFVEDLPKPKLVLSEDDPLFGVLEERQVEMHPILGRPKIAPEVLEGMRQYLRVADGEERKIREERVRKSVKEVELNPVTKRMVLRLEEPSVVTKDLDKGKGIVFGYDSSESKQGVSHSRPGGEKLLGAAIASGRVYPSFENSRLVNYTSESMSSASGFSSSDVSSTVYKTGLFEAGSSGTTKKQRKPRRRPYVKKRRLQELDEFQKRPTSTEDVEKPSRSAEKRKEMEEVQIGGKVARQRTKEMVPTEGPSRS